jgi:outer membrane protein TolC
MKFSGAFLATTLLFSGLALSAAGQNEESSPRHLTLPEAVQLALKHNHDVRIAGLEVEVKQHAKDVARSAYFPNISNESRVFTVTDTQFIQIPAGGLGTLDGTPNPTAPVTLSQGGKTFVISGTTLSQPLTQLLTKVKPANDAARAEVDAARENAEEAQHEVALRVHQIYYQILIAQLHRSAVDAKIRADQDLEKERGDQVKYGSVLEEQLIESKAAALEAKQDMLTTQLQISDLIMQLDDVMGIPVTTQLALDDAVPAVHDTCQREECVKQALASHPEILAARADVERASAGVKLAKADYYPEFSAFARYSYQSDVPFLARNFGTFGGVFTWDLFDGGRRGAALGESDSKLAEAKEALARVTDDVELKVQVALNKLSRTQEMIDVSQQVLTLRTESSRVASQKLLRGEALQSEADDAVSREFDAKTLLLQSQLGYVQAHDELLQAMGQTPE